MSADDGYVAIMAKERTMDKGLRSKRLYFIHKAYFSIFWKWGKKMKNFEVMYTTPNSQNTQDFWEKSPLPTPYMVSEII